MDRKVKQIGVVTAPIHQWKSVENEFTGWLARWFFHRHLNDGSDTCVNDFSKGMTIPGMSNPERIWLDLVHCEHRQIAVCVFMPKGFSSPLTVA
jgi:hypothetical protein